MKDDDPKLLRIARHIADGQHVAWEDLAAEIPDVAERGFLENLRHVAHIAWFHRSQQQIPNRTALVDSGSGRGMVGSPEPRRAGDAAEAAPRWGHLEIRARLGEGVFGEVYRAWETTLERDVALKLLRPVAAAVSVTGGAQAPHVLQEGRILARVRHPNIVTVYGAERYDGRYGIWMEYIRGRTLEDILQSQGPFGAREAALVGIDLTGALGAVHRLGLVHRDVKARNVMREEGGRIVLMDFGAGTEFDLESRSPNRAPAGTPAYLAPEIFLGQPASPQSDLYSLGVLLYHLVTSAFPVEGPSLRDIARMHERNEVRLLREARPDLPETFVQVVERALEAKPQKRFGSAGQFEQALVSALV